MESVLQEIVTRAREKAPALKSRPEFEAFKASYVGPKGELTAQMKELGKAPREQKPVLGKLVNAAKQQLEEIFEQTLASLDALEMAARMGEQIDPTLPASDALGGTAHLLTQIRREATDVLRRVGFVVAEGPELETEWFNFDALNTPLNHASRDAQDTLYLPENFTASNVKRRASERYLLRSHTSTVQIRTMLARKPPLAIIAPGRCFRRDTADATHSANFHQLEGLYVDARVTVKDLKAVLDLLVRELLGKHFKTRLRPSFFPFTEPSFELDVISPDFGKLSNRWLEIGGCGMVDPAVLSACEISPQKYSGYAFGFGLERIAMLRTGLDDIRLLYQNDLRLLRQFA